MRLTPLFFLALAIGCTDASKGTAVTDTDVTAPDKTVGDADTDADGDSDTDTPGTSGDSNG